MTETETAWCKTAIDNELQNIERLSGQSKPPKLTKPDSPITLCMLKIASVVKGCSLNPNEAYTRILYAMRSHPSSSKPREIDYQWKRCMQRAIPRYRAAQTLTR